MNINFIPAWDQGVLKPLEKLEVHKRGLRHKAVSVFLISNNNVLLQKRASVKYHTPGLWANTCCTHPSWSEDPKECAHRRLKEELGIKVSELVYKNKIDYKDIKTLNKFVSERGKIIPSRISAVSKKTERTIQSNKKSEIYRFNAICC